MKRIYKDIDLINLVEFYSKEREHQFENWRTHNQKKEFEKARESLKLYKRMLKEEGKYEKLLTDLYKKQGVEGI